MAMDDALEWDDDDHLTWADPSIRKDYEAALGRLILAHNEIDLRVTQLLERCTTRLGDPPAMAKLTQGELYTRMQNLMMLKALPIDLNLHAIDLERLVALNTDRNVVAHGHFEQNPFDGDYVLIRAKKRFEDYPTERLNRIAETMEKAARHLGAVIAFYDPPILPQGVPAGLETSGAGPSGEDGTARS